MNIRNTHVPYIYIYINKNINIYIDNFLFYPQVWGSLTLTPMKRRGAVESDSAKSARKAKDKLHKACERALETRE